MSAPQTTTQFAPAGVVGDNQVAPVTNKGLGPGGAGKQKEALKLRLDLNLEVEIAIQAKVNGDITLSLLGPAGAIELLRFNTKENVIFFHRTSRSNGPHPD
ncbi:hypothetical protein IW261DRAFT_1562051 [Armillaria novae-zelandiae]|uniref:Uncharacterized protein n=1 Tax=Armillaria novae-zelandiae TaxID=153914 RepID=A0AA39PDS0_9AGAR|nr:hypothetical protein IW261DRAFT_1562051 [Armillaria novae-zelandiae]